MCDQVYTPHLLFINLGKRSLASVTAFTRWFRRSAVPSQGFRGFWGLPIDFSIGKFFEKNASLIFIFHWLFHRKIFRKKCWSKKKIEIFIFHWLFYRKIFRKKCWSKKKVEIFIVHWLFRRDFFRNILVEKRFPKFSFFIDFSIDFFSKKCWSKLFSLDHSNLNSGVEGI